IIIKGGCFNGASYLNGDSSAYEIREMICFPSQADYESGKKNPLWISNETPSICFFTKHNLPENSVIRNEIRYLKVNLLQNIEEASLKIDYWRGRSTGLNNLSFNNRYQLYKYMMQFDGVKVPPFKSNLGQEGYKEYLKDNEIAVPNHQKYIDSINRILEDSFKKAKEYKDSINKKKGYLNETKSTNDLTITIENQKILFSPSDNKYFFHFDVYGYANNNSTYLTRLAFKLHYNTNAFGQNIHTNDKIIVENGETFNLPTYLSTDYVLDMSSSCIRLGTGIPFSIALPNPERTLVTTTPVELFKVKIELQNNLSGISSGIYFSNESDPTNVGSLFTPSSDAPTNYFIPYDTTYYINPQNYIINTMPPTISNFTPSTRRAGVGETITINGNNFGIEKGQVLFKDDLKYGNAFLNGIDTSYITTWTNTKIVVKVPSFVRKGYVNQFGQSILGYGKTACSGQIKICTARNDFVISEGNLNIEYSLTNSSNGTADPHKISRVYLARLGTCSDMIFTLHTSF
ncbi:MAG: hypothetical protein GX879_00935, partial [Bacteroidales bacterium]|nr:hypothetical protein [Bacteroidales bacterium]